ncbi:hypothetical protein MMC20_002625 [Loxospora ochrophaea]|nr:hypothetical protein [Loxospora ochrophaea]
MLDPFFAPPSFLTALARPIASTFSLSTLPLHIHEVLIAFAFYQFVNVSVSPYISTRLFPSIYPKLNARTKINWDVHAVSLVQSCLINVLALWIMRTDEERKGMDWAERVAGYTGGGGLVQGFATGYFLWDLFVCARNVSVFGWGLLAHAVAALVVFSLGFRPFLNFYGSTFILYELSTPFLNFHWFFDKLNMTGSRPQLYNGLVLLATFFSCRLVWGTYQSVRVYQDVYAALQSPSALTPFSTTTTTTTLPPHANEIMYFSAHATVPVWLACVYLSSNLVLNSLNFYWFGKMIETVRKRFQPPAAPVQDGKLPGAVAGKKGGGAQQQRRQEEERMKAEVVGNGMVAVTAEKREVRRRERKKA